jgi:16S rRNA C967 or C1407 C5-methylase (RsmB/RsmF family)
MDLILTINQSDFCSHFSIAPGSKTSQLLEIISSIPQGETEPKGYVVANDSDAKRAYMLVHQLRRLNSPATFVTAKDAQFWPMLLRGENTKDEERAQEGMFDRVLCDVPCTGDGTARKNPGIWKHWTASAGHSIHPLQVSIALNGARLTKVGGYMCYSTCSMNPIENEAVVSEILRATDGSLELVDKRPDMPGIVARPGWACWKVLGESMSRKELRNKTKKNSAKMRKRRKDWEDQQKLETEENDNQIGLDGASEKEQVEENVTDLENDNDWVSEPQSWEDEVLLQRAADQGLVEYKTFDDVPKDSTHHIRKSCFPPNPDEAAQFKLEKCLRCLPHDLDTGGFFVALFKKVYPLSSRARRKADELAQSISKRMDTPTNEPIATEVSDKIGGDDMSVEGEMEETGKAAEIGKKELLNKGKGCDTEKAESFVSVEEDVLPPLIDFYGFTDQFAKGQFMARAGGNSKLLYFITKSVKENLIERGIQDRIHVINSGLRALERRNKDDCLVK